MKQLAVIALLFLASCDDPICNGKIVSKVVDTPFGESKIAYYITISDGKRSTQLRVTEDAWNQAKNGVEWPFEVKKNETTSNNQNRQGTAPN